MNRLTLLCGRIGNRALRGALLLALLIGLGGLAAGDGYAAPAEHVDPAYRPRPARTLNYSMHIAQIFYDHCVVCHRPGEVAPFSLLTFADAHKHAKQIAEVVRDRLMPPWKAVHGWGEFQDERHLTNLQVGMIQQWVEEGAIEGDPKLKPSAPRFKSTWALGQPDMVLTMPRAFTVPADGRDLYPCIVLPIEIPADKWVRGVDFRPSCPSVVHHAIFFYDKSGKAKKRQDESEKLWDNPGYDSTKGMGFFPAGGIGGWGPGQTPRFLPNDVAGKLPKGVDLVLNLHYHPDGKVEKDKGQLAIYFTDQPPRRILTGFVMGTFHLDIPPGEKHYKAYDAFTLPVDLEIIEVAPHMHQIGRECRVIAQLPDGSALTLTQSSDASDAVRLRSASLITQDSLHPFGHWLDRPPADALKMIWVNDWDINWQGSYRYAHPLRLPKGTRLLADWSFDNSAENPRNPNNPPQRITFGGTSNDEMAGLIVAAIVDRPQDEMALQWAMAGHIAEVLVQPDVTKRDSSHAAAK